MASTPNPPRERLDQILNLVNNFFRERLPAVPMIQAYIELQQA
jgi:hypothetical protein